MRTAWETLFHLSRFMKYLLIEVLPQEQLDSPKYVVESLMELLNVTLECLNVIRNKNGPGVISYRSSFHADIEEETTLLLESCRSNQKDNKNDINFCDAHNEEAANDQHLLHHSTEPKKHSSSVDNFQNLNSVHSSSADSSQNLNSVVKYNSTIISQNFIILNNDILTGNYFGYYCLPCDCTFYDEIKWKNHCDNWDHITRIKKTKCAEFSCEKCKMLVFGNAMIAPNYINFHVQENHNISSFASSEFHSSGVPSRKDLFIEKKSTVESNEVIRSGSTASENHVSISYNFENVQWKVIEGFKKTGFYCNFCDAKFYDYYNWTEHFRNSEFHNQMEMASNIGNGKFYTCETCSFTIFAVQYMLDHLIIHHRNSHDEYSFNSQNITTTAIKTSNKTARSKDDCIISAGNSTAADRMDTVSRSTSKSEDLHVNTEDMYVLEQYSSSSDLSKKNSKYIFTKTFLDINNQIHSNNLVNVFYCRPCDQYCLIKTSKKQHCLSTRHINFISSETFKNFQSKCTYCKFTIIGTERTVHEYMRFHTRPHGVPSYSCESINQHGALQEESRHSKNIINEKQVAFSTRAQRKQNKQSQIKTSKKEITTVQPPFLSPMGYSNNDTTDAEFVQNEFRPNERNESSKDESFISKFIDVYMYRKNQKSSPISLAFAGFCIPCEYFVDSAFEWVDHLDSDKHCSVKSSNDEIGNINELNLRIFGNKTQFQDYL